MGGPPALLAVMNSTTGLVKGTIPLPGGSTAIYDASGLSYIRHTDWLGSSRLATTWNHTVYSKEAYAPFGETYNEAGTPDRSFTGQDQDVVTGSPATGVYDFLFRKYDPSAGRWLSPDPLGWGAVNPADPQSLNRYAYVENQPMNAVDPEGLQWCISNTVSSDGYFYGYNAGDNPCAAGFNPLFDMSGSGTPINPNPSVGGSGCDPTSNAACMPTNNPGNQNNNNNVYTFSNFWKAVFTPWTASKQTCHDLNAWASDLSFVGTGGGSALTLGALSKVIAPIAAAGATPLNVSSAWIKSWTGHHCS